MGSHIVIRVGDVVRFEPIIGNDSPKRRVMYVLITRIWDGDQKCCDCLMLYDSYVYTSHGWEAGSIVPWPYSYISDVEVWQKIL